MKRFIHSLAGRAVSRTVILTLLWNFIILVVPSGSSNAQFTTGQTSQWAVIDFVNKSKVGSDALGGVASDAVTTLLLGTNRFDILPRETIERKYQELGMTPPLTRELEVFRLGQSLGVETVITGEIKEARINRTSGGKSADVILIVRGWDVASQMPVMGTAVHGASSERPGDIEDEVVLNEAINFAAQKAVQNLLQQQIGFATVLTTPTTQFVTLNKGSRQGLKVGQEMVVLRRGEFVARVRVAEVNTDSAVASILSQNMGVAPGDKARVIYDKLENVVLTSPGSARVRSSGKSANDLTGVLLGLLVVTALVLILQDSGGGDSPGEVIAEPGLDLNGQPVVFLSWKPNLYNQGSRNRVEWQVWRSDVTANPVLVVPGAQANAEDSTQARDVDYRTGLPNGGTTCTEDPGATNVPGVAGIVPGTSYMYQVSLVFKLSSLDLPGGGNGDVTDCFFTTTRATAKGQATPLFPVQLTVPQNGATDVSNVVQFAWQSTPGANRYLVQISTSPNFTSSTTVRNIAVVDSIIPGGVSTDPIDISGIFPGTQRLYWRVGAKNTGDNPGPKKDPTGERYVFSAPFQFDRVLPPPPPPSE